jgi:hypothetical protein
MKAQKIIKLLEDKVVVIASHDDYPASVVLSQRLINLANELYNGPSWNASQPGYGQGAMTQTIPEGEKTPMVCQECGHRFKKTIGKGTFEVRCPKCGGFDTEPE